MHDILNIIFVICLKFAFNQVSCILFAQSGHPGPKIRRQVAAMFSVTGGGRGVPRSWCPEESFTADCCLRLADIAISTRRCKLVS